VITDHDLYFGDDRSPVQALYVWRGGLGIWGAITLGAVGVWLGARTKGIRVPPVLDAMVPGVLVAQAMGRWGNWFNQELFGKPSTQPWALKIDPENRPPGYEQFATFQPTFLYECLWDLGAFGFVIWADRRFKLGHGRVVALYVMAYTAGRGWIEMLRIDDVEYQHVLGLRLNVWTSIVLFCLAATYFVVVGHKRPGRETVVYTEKRLAADRAAAGAAEPAESDEGTTSEAKAKPPGEEANAAGDDGPSPGAATKAGVATALVDAPAEEPTSEKGAPAGTATEKNPPATKAPARTTPAKKAAAKTPAKKAAPAKKTTTAAATKKATTATSGSTANKATAAKKATAKKATPQKATRQDDPAEKDSPSGTDGTAGGS
jgi:prolipoprotein diacylglyceryltransferase